MRQWILAATIAAFVAAPAAGSSFAVFGSGWDPDLTGEALGGGASLSFGDTFGVDLRATYYRNAEIEDFDIGDDDDDLELGDLQIIPVEALLRYNFNSGGAANFYVGGGASYIILDWDEGPEIDDEVGWAALVGARFGDPEGLNFFIEGTYRGVEATVRADDLRDVFDDDDGTTGDDEFDEDVALNLDGPAINLGLVWSF